MARGLVSSQVDSANTALEVVSVLLVGAAFAGIQILIGGTRMLFSLPAYGLIGIAGILAVFQLRRTRVLPDRLCLASSAVFFGYVIVRALFSPVPYLARADLYSVLGGLAVYLLTACIWSQARPRMMLMLILFSLGIAHVAIGALQFRDGNNFMPIAWLQRFDYGRRASGFYVCPNHLAGMLEVLGIFSLSLVAWSRWPAWSKLLLAYGSCVCYAGLILTGSRGGYLSAVASLLVFALLSVLVLRKAGAQLVWKLGGAGVAIAAILAAAAIFFLHQSDYLSSRAHNVVDTENMRLDLWRAAVQQWKLQPVFGTGSGTYLFYGREFRTARMQLDPIEVHNDYLHLLAEYGLVGGAGFLVFLAAHLRRGWKTFARLGPKRVAIAPRLLSNGLALNIGAHAAVAAYLVHSIFDFNLHIPANVLLLAFVFGLLANAGGSRDDEGLSEPRRSFAWSLLLPALGAFLLLQAVRLLPAEYFAEKARTALRDTHPAEAIQAALRGLETENANPALYYTLGAARAALAEEMRDPRIAASFYAAAIEAFQSARTLAPQDETYALELGFAYDAIEQFDPAEKMYQVALALDPNSDATRQYYEAHLQSWHASASAPAPSPFPRESN